MPTDSERMAALSNRAAAQLVLGRFAEGEADCCAALALALAALDSTAGPHQPAGLSTETPHAPPSSLEPAAHATQTEELQSIGDVHHSGTAIQQADRQQLGPSSACSHCSEQSAGAAAQPLTHDSSSSSISAQWGDAALLQAAAGAAASAAQGLLAGTAASAAAAEAALQAYVLSLLHARSGQRTAPGSVGAGANSLPEQCAGAGSCPEQRSQEAGREEGQGGWVDGDQVQGQSMAQQQQQQEGLQQQQQQRDPASGQQGQMGLLLGSVARLLARRSALRGHMRRYQQALSDCELAAGLFDALGEGCKAGQLRGDEGRLRELVIQPE